MELYRVPPPSKSERKPRQLPPPLELMELHRLPPLEIGTETSPTTPPRIDGTSSTTLPSKSERKPRQLPPPSNWWNFIDYPPLEIGTETSPTTPPIEFFGNWPLWQFLISRPALHCTALHCTTPHCTARMFGVWYSCRSYEGPGAGLILPDFALLSG